MRRLLFNFPNYFTDILLIKYGFTKIYLNKGGTLFPTIAKMWQNFEYLNNIAKKWQIYWGRIIQILR